MKVTPTILDGVVVVQPKLFSDSRGFFFETFRAERFREAGLPDTFVQDNLSHSIKGVVRGLHFQSPHGQGKLVSAFSGTIFDVAVDIRPHSKQFKKWVGVELSAENQTQLYIPEGFAHGFCVLSATAIVHYKCTTPYRPDCEQSVLWNDPDLSIAWPEGSGILSEKDARAPRLKEIAESRLPV